MTIVIIASVEGSLINFRGSLIEALVKMGNRVITYASGHNDRIARRLKEIGAEHNRIFLQRTGLNPFRDIYSFLQLTHLIKKSKPDIVLSYTIKPVIYGSLAAWIAKVPKIFSIITGLGYIFSEEDSWHRIMKVFIRSLYKTALSKNITVFFQNPDDQTLFLEKGLVRPDQPVLINGSGVDLNYFTPSKLPDEPIFLMIGRLLADKGVREYVEAADRIKKRLPNARFFLVGYLDPNPNSIRESELRQWQKAGIIEYLGYLEDVRPLIQKCRCYILPSYREGTPRTVLEAMAMGRPIITTDAPGCRETVVLTPEGQRQREFGEGLMIGENGFLVRVRDVEALVKAIVQFLENADLAERMAKRSREIAEEKFDVHKVNAVILKNMGLIK